MNTTKSFNKTLQTKVLQSIFEALNELSYDKAYGWNGNKRQIAYSDRNIEHYGKIMKEKGEEIKRTVNCFVDEQVTAHINLLTSQATSQENH